MDGIERVWKIGGFSGWAAINLDRKKMRMAPQIISYGIVGFCTFIGLCISSHMYYTVIISIVPH